jgi:hypothetical protein
MYSGVMVVATAVVAGAVAVTRGTATPVAIDPTAAAARMARVMIRFVRIESSMAKAEFRSLGSGNSTAHDCAVVSSYNRSGGFSLMHLL